MWVHSLSNKTGSHPNPVLPEPNTGVAALSGITSSTGVLDRAQRQAQWDHDAGDDRESAEHVDVCENCDLCPQHLSDISHACLRRTACECMRSEIGVDLIERIAIERIPGADVLDQTL